MYSLVVVVIGSLLASVPIVIKAVILRFVYCYNVKVGFSTTAVKYPSIAIKYVCVLTVTVTTGLFDANYK
jgi:uncharacterized membrane protein